MNTNTQNTTKYKNSPLGLIPEDWEVKKFKDILEEGKLGGNYENSEANEGVPVMKMGNLGRGVMNINKVQYLPENEKYNEDDILKEGDLLFNTRNTLDLVGKVSIWRNELPFSLYNSNLMRMKFNEKYVGSNDFMNFAFNSHYLLSQLRGIATGTTSVAAIYGKDLNRIKFLLPLIEEQAAIANCLSTWDKAIEKHAALIAQKELAKKALMQQLLSGKKRLKGFSGEWKKLKLGVDCELITKGTTPTSLGREFKDQGVNFIKIESLEENGTIIPNKVAFIDEQTHEMLKRSQLKENDILISIAGALGRVALVNKETLPANTNQALAIIRLKKESKLKLKYLYYFLNSPKVKKEIDAINVQAAQANLSLSNINDLTVLYPEFEEQTAIANVLQCADDELQLLKKKREQLKEQKKGLMQVLLTGKKRLRY
jgi:type I restriction enzyme, S subunit